MTEREKAIKGLQECDLNGGRIGNCPYKDAILSMLKEQEETIKQKDKEIEDLIEAYNFEH